MSTEKKIQTLLGIVAFSTLFWGFQAQSIVLQYMAFGCIRLVVVLGVYHLSVEQKEKIQRHSVLVSASILMLLLRYGAFTGQRIIACIAIGILVSLLWALGVTGSIWTATYWGIYHIPYDMLIYSIAVTVSMCIWVVYVNRIGIVVYLLLPFVFGTLVAIGSFFKGSSPKQLRHNIVFLLSFGVGILVSMWLCIDFVMQYFFHN